jgi:hypothetical protein
VQNFSSSESDNISNTTTTTNTQSTDEKRLERLLKNVEDFVKDMELASEESGKEGKVEDSEALRIFQTFLRFPSKSWRNSTIHLQLNLERNNGFKT